MRIKLSLTVTAKPGLVSAVVSNAWLLSVVAALVLPAASVTAPALSAKLMLPLATPAFGVTFTVQVVPLPVMLEIEPLVTVKSSIAKPVTASAKV